MANTQIFFEFQKKEVLCVILTVRSSKSDCWSFRNPDLKFPFPHRNPTGEFPLELAAKLGEPAGYRLHKKAKSWERDKFGKSLDP